MSNIQPFSLPKPVSRAERRRWDEGDRRDAARQMNRRRNVDPNAPSKLTVCPDSKYGTHRFVRGRTGMHCEFCLQPEAACTVTP